MILLFSVLSILGISYAQIPAEYVGNTYTVVDQVYWDMAIGGVLQGRIVFGMYTDIAPLTVKNFMELSNHTNNYGYRGSTCHRTISRFMNQCGDFVYGDGVGFDSIYGGEFEDESFAVKHVGPGSLGMANRGPDTNGCQIYITTALTSWLDNKHVIFGVVLEGMDVVRMIEWNPTTPDDRPILPVVIVDSGIIPGTKRFAVPHIPVTGDRFPDDLRFPVLPPKIKAATDDLGKRLDELEAKLQDPFPELQSQIEQVSMKLQQLQSDQQALRDAQSPAGPSR